MYFFINLGSVDFIFNLNELVLSFEKFLLPER